MFRNFVQVVDNARKLETKNLIVLASRSDSYKSKLYSIALAVVSTDLL